MRAHLSAQTPREFADCGATMPPVLRHETINGNRAKAGKSAKTRLGDARWLADEEGLAEPLALLLEMVEQATSPHKFGRQHP